MSISLMPLAFAEGVPTLGPLSGDTPPLTVNVQDIREACATETTGINFLLLNEKMRNCKYQKNLETAQYSAITLVLETHQHGIGNG